MTFHEQQIQALRQQLIEMNAFVNKNVYLCSQRSHSNNLLKFVIYSFLIACKCLFTVIILNIFENCVCRLFNGLNFERDWTL